MRSETLEIGFAMRRISTILFALCFMSLSFVTSVAAEKHQSSVLQHFITLPAGLGGEGLAIHNGHFYVATFSFTAADGTILVYDGRGILTDSITVPGYPGVGQLAFAGERTLYAVAGNLNTAKGAVVRVDLDTGKVNVVASGFKVANGLAVDDSGNLFVTDLVASAVYKVTPAGDMSVYASGPLLASANVPQAGLTLGTNDIAFNREESALYVTDVGLGTLVKISVNLDGTAGQISNFATVPTPDGLAFDVRGNIYVASIFTNTIQLVHGDGTVQKLGVDTSHESFNNPSNIAFLGRRIYITNLALSGTSSIDFLTVQSPGLPLEG